MPRVSSSEGWGAPASCPVSTSEHQEVEAGNSAPGAIFTRSVVSRPAACLIDMHRGQVDMCAWAAGSLCAVCGVSSLTETPLLSPM